VVVSLRGRDRGLTHVHPFADPDVIAGRVHTRWVEEEFIDGWVAARAAAAEEAS